MRCRFTIWLVLSALFVTFSSVGQAHAGKEAVANPLPTRFFSDKTIMVTHVNLEAVSADRLYQAAKALVPAKYQEDMNLSQMKTQLGMVDMVVAQLKTVGVTRLTAIGVTTDPKELTSTSTYVLAPVSLSASKAEKEKAMEVLTGLGAMMKMKAEAIPGWIVLHNSESLPETDELAIEDAAFNDALTVNPDHDLAFVIVPTKEMRKSMAEGMEKSLAEASAEEREALKHVGVLAESEWYYISMVFGADPDMRIATKASSNAKAQQFSRAWASMLREGKEQIKKQVEEELAEARKKKEEKGIDYDPEDFDPEPMLKVLDAFAAEPDGQMMAVEMDKAELKDVTYGLIKIAEGIGEALGEAMAAPLGAE